VGVILYQKLYHMVHQRCMQGRAACPVLTRQPLKGVQGREFEVRRNGTRFLIGHGAAMALKERLLDESDRVMEYVCSHCGMIATLDKRRNITICHDCGAETDIHPVEMSYALNCCLMR